MFERSRIYLDWAAAAPVSSSARREFIRTLDSFGNPSSPHEEGREAHEALEDARTRIARLVSVKPDAVLFTSGATEANALAIEGHVRALIAKGRSPEDMHVLYLPSAHASTRGAMESIRRMGVRIEEIALSEMRIDTIALEKQFRSDTVLVALDLVCGETGVRFQARDVRRMLDAQSSNAVLHVDASQAPYEESILLTRLGADTLSLDAQKVGGVRGIGVLIAPRRVPLMPLVYGGGQERGLRPGTESPALAAAFAAALEACAPEEFSVRARSMRQNLIASITASLPDVLVNEGKDQAYHILNLSCIGRDTDYLVALLSEKGFAVSTRSACETDEEGSRAVLALTKDMARAASTLRISWGPETKEGDLVRLSAALISSVRFMDENQV